MNQERLNLKNQSLQILIESTVSINCTLKINRRNISLTTSEDKKSYKTSIQYIDSIDVNLIISLTAEEEGILKYKILSQGIEVFKSEYLEIPGKGTYTVTEDFQTQPSFSQRDEPHEERMEYGLPKARLNELWPINLFHNNGRTEVLREATVNVPVFYATSRDPINDESGKLKDYGIARHTLSYGTANISIPKNKRKGEIPRPAWWKCQWKENPEKHITILQIDIKNQEDYYRELNEHLVGSGAHDVLLFIHGYNESFKSSILRAAQIAFDIDFKGVVSAFSWPSANKLIGYGRDLNTVDYSLPHLKQYLLELKKLVPNGKIHILAHSMGNEHLSEALKGLSESLEENSFNQLIMAAPDTDMKLFGINLAAQITKYSQQVTIYASTRDRALNVSSRIRLQDRRLGQINKKMILFDKIDTIDVSLETTDLLGHGYFSETSSIITDIQKMIKFGHCPTQRNLVKVPFDTRHYWKFPNTKDN